MSWNIGDKRNLFLKLKTKLGLSHVEHKSKDSPGKITLTLIESQQLPDNEKVDSNDEIACSNGQFAMVGDKYASAFKLIQLRRTLSCTAVETLRISRILKWI